MASPSVPNTTDSPSSAPPWRIHATPAGGVPISDFIGNDPTSLSWVMPYPPGTQLLLSVVDGAGHQGGVPPMYTVRAGINADCTPFLSSTLEVFVNATTLGPCDSAVVSIKGGVKPYNLTITIERAFEFLAPMGANDSEFVFLNNGPPGQRVLFSAQDAIGSWAKSTRFVTLSAEGVCPTGTPSGNGAKAPPASQPPELYYKSQPRNRVGAIVGGIVGTSAGLLLIMGAIFYYRRRRNGPYEIIDKAHIRYSQFKVDPYTPRNTTYVPSGSRSTPTSATSPTESDTVTSATGSATGTTDTQFVIEPWRPPSIRTDVTQPRRAGGEREPWSAVAVKGSYDLTPGAIALSPLREQRIRDLRQLEEKSRPINSNSSRATGSGAGSRTRSRERNRRSREPDAPQRPRDPNAPPQPRDPDAPRHHNPNRRHIALSDGGTSSGRSLPPAYDSIRQ